MLQRNYYINSKLLTEAHAETKRKARNVQCRVTIDNN